MNSDECVPGRVPRRVGQAEPDLVVANKILTPVGDRSSHARDANDLGHSRRVSQAPKTQQAQCLGGWPQVNQKPPVLIFDDLIGDPFAPLA